MDGVRLLAVGCGNEVVWFVFEKNCSKVYALLCTFSRNRILLFFFTAKVQTFTVIQRVTKNTKQMGNSLPKNIVGTVESFTEEEYSNYESNCRPGGNGVNEHHAFLGMTLGSSNGFIDHNESLKQVAIRDHKTVVDLLGPHGHDMIALRLSQSMSSSNDGNDAYIASIVPDLPHIRDHLELTTQSFCGSQGCPFWKEVLHRHSDTAEEKLSVSVCGGTGSSDYTITNKNNGLTMQISSLMPHLIYYHHFYEGNVSNRVDPVLLIQLLEIDPTQFKNAKWALRDDKGVFTKEIN